MSREKKTVREQEPPAQPEPQILQPIDVDMSRIPERLQSVNQWVVWRYEVIQAAEGDGEIKKPPFSPTTGKRASVTRPDTWGSFADACTACAAGHFAGVGIVLTPALGIVGIDIDHCITDGQISEEAQQIIQAINSYTERSPSGTGIRMFTSAKLPGAFRRKGNIELYEDIRYLTVTGQHIASTPAAIQPRHRELYSFYHRLFPHQKQENTGVGGGKRAASFSLIRPDETVMQKALAARNGANFKRYYHGDSSLWEGLGAKHRSQSEADFTLVLMLLYWTNGDSTQVDRLFRQSGLMREKWDRPIKGNETYGERIIKDAIAKGRH